MLSGDFERRIKQLNKRFSIVCNENPKFPAALYYVMDQDRVHICGVDMSYLPEFTVWDGRLVAKGGWRRVLKILVGKGLVDRRSVLKVFGVDMSYGWRPKQPRWEDPIEKALKEARHQAKLRAQKKSAKELEDTKDGREVHYYDVDDLVQIHRMRNKGRN